MTFRARIFAGLLAALVVGLLGQTFAAVAWMSGSGNRSISGRVIAEDMAPVAGLCVEAHEADGANPAVQEAHGWYAPYATTTTAADGTYTLRRLLPIGYKIRFQECPSGPGRVPVTGGTFRFPGEMYTRHPHVAEWWNNERTFEKADVVTVPADSDVTGIDAVVASL